MTKEELDKMAVSMKKTEELRRFLHDTISSRDPYMLVTISEKFREIAVCFGFSAANDPKSMSGKSTEQLVEIWEDFVSDYFKWDKTKDQKN